MGKKINPKTRKTQMSQTFFHKLNDELSRRISKNSAYSLRSFARDLQIEPSALSKILSGRRLITDKMKFRLGEALGISLPELLKTPNDEKQFYKWNAQSEYQMVEQDTFALISEWYYFALLELTYLDDFLSDPKWMSRKIGITESQCRDALASLIRLGLLEVSANGEYKDVSPSGKLTSLHPTASSAAARSYQAQALEISKNSIKDENLDRRNHTSAVFCFSSKDFKKATEKITEFRRQFASEFQPTTDIDEVYQIQISFFPLTKK